MKRNYTSESGLFGRPVLVGLGFCLAGSFLAFARLGQYESPSASSLPPFAHVTWAAEPFLAMPKDPGPQGEGDLTLLSPATRSTLMARWDSVPGAAGYRLDVSTSSSFSDYATGYQDLDVGKATGRVVTDLKEGTTYYYRVRAYGASGTSGDSAVRAASTVPTGGLMINPIFESTILNDPNSVAIQATIHQAISILESQFSDSVTVSILFRYANTADPCGEVGTSFLGRSCTWIYTEPWTVYINRLLADASTSNDNTANASLPGSALSTNIAIASANGRAVGLNTPGGLMFNGAGPYDATITLNPMQPLQFSRPPSPSTYDAQRTIEHEIDEVLGLGANANGGGTNNLRPQDLFSWSSAGNRNLSTSGSRYLSINSGSTNIVNFNQTAGGDLGDWISPACPQPNPYVQNAFSCKNQFSDVTATSPEGINLDVIGYDLGSTSLSNDQCSGAIALSANVLRTDNTTNATSTGDPTPTCEPNFGKGVWYSFVPASNGTVTVSTCGSNFDTIVQVYTGSCASLTAVPGGCNDDNGPDCSGSGGPASVSFSGAAGTTYRILAGGFSSLSGNLQIVARVTGNPTPTPTPRTLTVASTNPSSGVSITVSPNDNNGQGSGTTQFTRVYNNNQSVALTAPVTASGNNFQKWQRDGSDWSTSSSTTVTMDANHTMTAVYATTPPPTPTPGGSCTQNFDAVTAPILPPGWTATLVVGNPPTWVTSTSAPDSAPNDAFVDDQTGISDKSLESGSIAITSALAQLSFRNNFNTEHDPPPNEVFWDGGVLEVSSPNINGGAFTDVTNPAVGGSFVTGGYTGTIDGTAGNPLAGRMAWSGNSGGYINTVVNLGPSVNGQAIKVRFRLGTDEAVSAPGWRIDNFSVTGGSCATATPTPPPTPTTLGNIATRLRVETGNNVMIGGFIVAGTQPKSVIVRAIGPSLAGLGISGALANPNLELRDGNGALLISNDNWQDNPAQAALITAAGLAPGNNLESAVAMTLPANNAGYTAIVRGVNNTTGIGVVEVYDVDRSVNSKLANISTRGFVNTGDNVMIGGMIVVGNSPANVIIRAIGPSLINLGVPNALPDPTLELRDGNGAVLAFNDDWQSDQQAIIITTGLAPTHIRESAIVRSLSPGPYTAIVREFNNLTGVALVEAYQLP